MTARLHRAPRDSSKLAVLASAHQEAADGGLIHEPDAHLRDRVMSDVPDATLREIVTRLQVVVETLDKTVTRLVDKTVSLETHQALERRVTGLEGAVTWAARLIIGAIILALLALVITQGGGSG